MTPPTKYTESNALLAMQSGNRDEAERILAGMFPSELRTLARACDDLADAARRESIRQRSGR